MVAYVGSPVDFKIKPKCLVPLPQQRREKERERESSLVYFTAQHVILWINIDLHNAADLNGSKATRE